MKDVQSIFEGVFKTRSPAEDEYINESDSLIYCKACNTPRQAKIIPKGSDSPFFPPIMCRCRKEKAEAEERARQQRQFEIEVGRLRTAGLQDRALAQYTFQNDKGYSSQIVIARRYVQKFSKLEKKGTGLLLWGEVGSGKTFMASCIANALLDQRIPVLMTNFARILNSMTSRINGDWNAVLDGFDRYRLLIIDDLGVERNSEFALEQVFSVIDTRCQSNRPMIITTNLTLHSMKNATDLAHARIYDRVLEHCLPVCVTGKKIRRQIAEENMNAMRNVLGNTGKQPRLMPNRYLREDV